MAMAIIALRRPGPSPATIAMASRMYGNAIRMSVSRMMSVSNRFILVRHVVPHLLSPVIVACSLDVGAKILATSGLSFLGLGTQPPTADWGSMLATGRQFVILSPHVVLLPGLAIFVIVLALNLVGDALRDLLDPRVG